VYQNSTTKEWRDIPLRDAEYEWLKFFLGILLPANRGYVALFTRSSDDLVAYFDESMGPHRLPMTSVAGYLFEPNAYLDFDKGMRKLLRDNEMCFFRTQDCFHLDGWFKQFRGTDSKRPNEIEREVIGLIRKHAVLGVGAAVSEARYLLLQPAIVDLVMGGAYSMLCQWCLAEIGLWCDRNNFNGKIAYFFEAGCPSQKDANAILDKISRNPEFVRRYRYGSHGFIPKMRMRGLQAGDMLAWFSRREAEEVGKILEGVRPRDRRKDFQALLGNTDDELKEIEHRFKYFEDESLKSFLSDDQNTDPVLRWYSFTPGKRLPQ
jgi:hypothetical protein